MLVGKFLEALCAYCVHAKCGVRLSITVKILCCPKLTGAKCKYKSSSLLLQSADRIYLSHATSKDTLYSKLNCHDAAVHEA